MENTFPNRAEAGRRLAEKLEQYAGRDDVIVLGLPRGGVPVAYEVAQRLGVPLDVFIVRKLGVPGFEELALGAIAQQVEPVNVVAKTIPANNTGTNTSGQTSGTGSTSGGNTGGGATNSGGSSGGSSGGGGK